MVIGWLADHIGITGGAEVSDAAFLAAVPDDVEIVHCPPGKRPPASVSGYVVNNCITYDDRWLEVLAQKPIVRHIHDLWPYGSPLIRRWLLDHAALVLFNSPKHRETFQFPVSAPCDYVHPPVDVARFRTAAREADERVVKRSGVIWFGRISVGKGIQNVADWALRTGTPVDFYGHCYEPLAMSQIVLPCRYCGAVGQDELPELLTRYKAFVHMPVKPDVCGRTAAEAWAAGLELELGGNADIDALYDWLDTKALQNAPRVFWAKVLETIGGHHYGTSKKRTPKG